MSTNSRQALCRFVAIISFCLLLFGSHLWGQTTTLKEYIYMDGKLVAVKKSCVGTISATSTNVPVGGATGLTISFTCASGCTWIVSSNAPWIHVTSAGSGTANGTPNNVVYNVDPNNGPSRTGTIAIAGQAYTITQAACTYILTASSTNYTINGTGNGVPLGTITVTCNGTSCAWTAAASSIGDWIHITNNGSGPGTKIISYSVGAHTGAPRTGTITVGGQTFTVNQAGCVYTLNLQYVEIPYSGAPVLTVAFTCDSGCPWTAVSDSPSWLAVASGSSSGSGAATVNINVAPNTAGTARSGIVTIGGKPLIVNQQPTPPIVCGDGVCVSGFETSSNCPLDCGGGSCNQYCLINCLGNGNPYPLCAASCGCN
jgi:hypothetical protein